MLYADQAAYDNATEPELSDYRDSVQFEEFLLYVLYELADRRKCCGIEPDLFFASLPDRVLRAEDAKQRVEELVTEQDFKEWQDDNA